MNATGTMRAARRELQAIAGAEPLARAERGAADEKFFRKIDREISWCLTLNK